VLHPWTSANPVLRSESMTVGDEGFRDMYQAQMRDSPLVNQELPAAGLNRALLTSAL
jgi:hypothetical protein